MQTHKTQSEVRPDKMLSVHVVVCLEIWLEGRKYIALTQFVW